MRTPVYIVALEREEDGRWLAEIQEFPGVMAYGSTKQEAVDAAIAICVRVIADRLAHREEYPHSNAVESLFAVA